MWLDKGTNYSTEVEVYALLRDIVVPTPQLHFKICADTQTLNLNTSLCYMISNMRSEITVALKTESAACNDLKSLAETLNCIILTKQIEA